MSSRTSRLDRPILVHRRTRVKLFGNPIRGNKKLIVERRESLQYAIVKR